MRWKSFTFSSLWIQSHIRTCLDVVNFPPLNFERKSGFSASSQFLSMRQFASKNIIMQLDAQIAALQIEERMLLVTPHATCFFFFCPTE